MHRQGHHWSSTVSAPRRSMVQGAEKWEKPACAVAYIDISLSDFENDGVLQIDDI
jgi:hypothetical protein